MRIDESTVKQIIDFRNARDWAQFHTPENLAKSIAIESAEILEHFQWGDTYDADELKDELADVLIYSILMANAIGADLDEVIRAKLEKNASRFPVDRVKGNSGKHTKVE